MSFEFGALLIGGLAMIGIIVWSRRVAASLRPPPLNPEAGTTGSYAVRIVHDAGTVDEIVYHGVTLAEAYALAEQDFPGPRVSFARRLRS